MSETYLTCSFQTVRQNICQNFFLNTISRKDAILGTLLLNPKLTVKKKRFIFLIEAYETKTYNT